MTTLSEKYAWNIATDADKRLTDAAPELLTLARAFVEDVECYCADYVAAPSPCTHCIAKGLIAKAEGR